MICSGSAKISSKEESTDSGDCLADPWLAIGFDAMTESRMAGNSLAKWGFIVRY